MNGNRDSLNDLAEEVVDILNVIRKELEEKQHALPSSLAAFNQSCQNLIESLDGITEKLKKYENPRKGILYFFARFFRAQKLNRELAGHKAKIESLKSGFTISTVVSTRMEVSNVKENVRELRQTSVETYQVVTELQTSLVEAFHENSSRLEVIREDLEKQRAAVKTSVDQSTSGTPGWNVETVDRSANHVIHNAGTGSFTSVHGATIRTHRTRKTHHHVKAHVRDYSKGKPKNKTSTPLKAIHCRSPNHQYRERDGFAAWVYLSASHGSPIRQTSKYT